MPQSLTQLIQQKLDEFEKEFVVRHWIKQQTYHKGRWDTKIRGTQSIDRKIKSFLTSALREIGESAVEAVRTGNINDFLNEKTQ